MQAEKLDFDKLTAGLKTKSEKIRVLSRHGVSTAEIARYLDIRYQHARNVLKDAGLHRTGENGAAQPTVPYAWVELDPSGRLVLPHSLMAGAGLGPGLVHVRLSEDGIEILSRKAALARAQAIVAPYLPQGRALVDEFIADRRQEAERE